MVAESVRALILCIEVLGRDHGHGAASEYRKAYLQIITLSLDKSDSTELLLAITKIVGVWLKNEPAFVVKTDQAPQSDRVMILNTKEKQSLMHKISTLDQRLPEAQVQPLLRELFCTVFDHVARVCHAAHCYAKRHDCQKRAKAN